MRKPHYHNRAPGATLTSAVADPAYAETLRAAIKAAGSSRRKLSADFAEQTGNERETEYRSLGKYLSKTKPELPSRERAAILAVLLNEPRVALVSDSKSRRRDRLGELAATVDDLLATVEDLKNQVATLQRRTAVARRASGGR